MDAVRNLVRKKLEEKTSLKLSLQLKVDTVFLPNDVNNKNKEELHDYLSNSIEEDIEFLKDILRNMV